MSKEETILATGDQIVGIMKVVTNTYFGMIVRKDDRPPACSAGAMRRFLQLFVEIPEFRRICERHVSMETLKEYFKDMIEAERLKYWQKHFGDPIAIMIMGTIGWVYEHKFELKPPVNNLLDRVKKAVFWQKIEKVEVLLIKSTHYFVPEELFVRNFLGEEKLNEEDKRHELAWICLCDQILHQSGHFSPDDLQIRLEKSLPYGHYSGVIYGNLRELIMRAILNFTINYDLILKFYKDGNFPLGFRGEDKEKKTLLVLCEE